MILKTKAQQAEVLSDLSFENETLKTERRRLMDKVLILQRECIELHKEIIQLNNGERGCNHGLVVSFRKEVAK